MSAVGFTPIQLYRTTTASAAPVAGNLADGELALNTTDEKLYFKNASGVVKLLAWNGVTDLSSPPPIGNTAPNTGAFTTLSASSTVSGAGFTARFAAPGPIGSTTPSTGAFTTLSATASGVTNPVLVSQVSNTPTYGALHFGTGYASNTMMGVYGLQSDKMYYNVPTGSAHRVSVAGTAVVDIASTGVAVTGTFSASGAANLNSTLQVKGSSTLANAQAFIDATDTETNIYASSSSGVAKTLKLYGSGGGLSSIDLTGSSVSVNVNLAVTGAVTATTTMNTGGYTVATLPAGSVGDRAYVTDATAPTFLGALTGGGAVRTPVFKNASAWVAA